MANASYAGEEFKDDRDFSAYISGLKLTTSSLDAAVSKLESMGFSCLRQNVVHCSRESKNLVCTQKQSINLTESQNRQGSLEVATRLRHICL
jgi:hypothetical protein